MFIELAINQQQIFCTRKSWMAKLRYRGKPIRDERERFGLQETLFFKV
jgi:hypothetical protein